MRGELSRESRSSEKSLGVVLSGRNALGVVLKSRSRNENKRSDWSRSWRQSWSQERYRSRDSVRNMSRRAGSQRTPNGCRIERGR